MSNALHDRIFGAHPANQVRILAHRGVNVHLGINGPALFAQGHGEIQKALFQDPFEKRRVRGRAFDEPGSDQRVKRTEPGVVALIRKIEAKNAREFLEQRHRPVGYAKMKLLFFNRWGSVEEKASNIKISMVVRGTY